MESSRWIFFLAWALVTFAGSYLFYYKKDAAFKQKYFPWFTVAVAMLVVLYVAWLGFSLPAVLLIILAVTTITRFNLRGTFFCPTCGSTIYDYVGKPRRCPKCGARLDAR
jgi:hypothetical protein